MYYWKCVPFNSTHQVHQSVFPFHPLPQLNTPSWLWGTWSICSPGSSVLQCHSGEDAHSKWKPRNSNAVMIYYPERKSLTGHTRATMVWIFFVFPLLSVSLSRKKKYSFASLGSVPSGIRWASMKIGSKWKKGRDYVWTIGDQNQSINMRCVDTLHIYSPLSHLELCWSVRTAFRLVRLLKMAASVPMKSMYMPENSSWSRRMHTCAHTHTNQQSTLCSCTL